MKKACLRDRGFTLLEIIIYVAMLAILLISAVQLVLISSKIVLGTRSERAIFSTGEGAMETLVREVRQASEVIPSSSNFGVNPGTLVLRTTQAPGGPTVITRTFSLSSERLIKNDGGADEFLTPPEARIKSLFFWHSATSTSDAIKIEMTIEAGDSRNLVTKKFYGTAVLRAKY